MAIAWKFTPPAINGVLAVSAAADAAVEAAAHLVLDAAAPNVPVADGVLKASGRVVDGEAMAGISLAHVTYGSDDDSTAKHAPSNQYVVKQHEDGELAHPNGGTWKWLEHAMHAEASHVAEHLASGLRKVLE
ncbi:hypothetical protein [Jatrophihabitans sp.]|uniref:hypothetical protein n=1 Tax=Jatrophihabitans sp. TaxID=1932789 RepID=UPI0030C783A7|nr:hypothetical protein [Jatrophihabitans sp.]